MDLNAQTKEEFFASMDKKEVAKSPLTNKATTKKMIMNYCIMQARLLLG